MRPIHTALTAACALAVLSMAAVAQMTTPPATMPAAAGATSQPANLLKDTKFEDIGGAWQAQSQEGGEVEATRVATTRPTLVIDVTKVTDTDWHAQVSQANLSLKKGKTYTLTFTAKASKPTTIVAFLQMLADPYTMLSDRQEISIGTEPKEQKVEFTATDDSTDGKLCLAVGTKVSKIEMYDVSLVESK